MDFVRVGQAQWAFVCAGELHTEVLRGKVS